MKRAPVVAILTAVAASPATAQYRGPRSAEHLFGAQLWGSRALWVNPAAMGTVDDASIMLEGVVQRDTAGDYPLAQLTFGFASRGFGLGVRHDYFHTGIAPDSLVSTGGNTWRLGFGRGLGALAIGAAVSMYSGTKTKEDVDIGLRYLIEPGLALAVALEHIGQPVVRDSALRFGGRAGVSWTFLGGVGGIDLEAQGSDEADAGGILMAYRGGLRIRTGGHTPFALNAVLQLDSGFDVAQALVGLSIGADYLGNLVLGGVHQDGSDHLTSISVLGQASRRFH